MAYCLCVSEIRPWMVVGGGLVVAGVEGMVAGINDGIDCLLNLLYRQAWLIPAYLEHYHSMAVANILLPSGIP